jgi:hypothetical protein
VNKAGQTITFTDSLPASAIYSTGLSHTLSATDGGSGNAVTFSVSGPGSLSGGSTLNITGAGTVTVTANQAANGNYTAAPAVQQSIQINNPVPILRCITPAFTSAGGAAFTLTVSGLGFTASSTVYGGASALVTTYSSATQLTAQVTAAEIATAGTTAITV